MSRSCEVECREWQKLRVCPDLTDPLKKHPNGNLPSLSRNKFLILYTINKSCTFPMKTSTVSGNISTICKSRGNNFRAFREPFFMALRREVNNAKGKSSSDVHMDEVPSVKLWILEWYQTVNVVPHLPSSFKRSILSQNWTRDKYALLTPSWQPLLSSWEAATPTDSLKCE